MNVTPTPAMFKAMSILVTKLAGEEPGKLEKTPAAERRREARREAFDVLHQLVALSMRTGVARYLQEIGLPTREATSIESATADDKPVPTVQ
jgi:hypothetical protein